VLPEGIKNLHKYAFNDIPRLRSISSPSGVEDKCFNLTCDFMSDECSIDGVGASEVVYTQDDRYEPYYNMVDYEKRSANYDDFASDDFYLTTEVDTSEELFWAVSTHTKPIIKDTTSRAYLIYEEAKKVLREIICDDMTDYEKVLSIFDYIMTSTTYDHNAYNNGTHNPMQYACYYLEAVFLNPNKVSVCDGYSKAFTLLCNMEGINSVRVVGTAGMISKGGHAWNKVEIDGQWYVVDITWTELEGNSDDVIHYSKEEFMGEPYASAYLEIDEEVSCHSYFLISDDEIKYTHSQFKNRFLYGIINANESFDYYTSDYITTENGVRTRYVSTIEEVADILEHTLKYDGSGVEMVINTDLFYEYRNDILDILIDARKSFCAVSYYTPLLESDTIEYDPNGVVVDGETLYHVKGMVYAGFQYNSAREQGIYLIVCPSVSLTTNTRLSDYVDFVIDNQIKISTEVDISKAKIDELITTYAGGNVEGLSDEQRIAYMETCLQQLFALNGANISVNITRTADDVVENLYTQDEQGNWGFADLELGKFSIEFTYA